MKITESKLISLEIQSIYEIPFDTLVTNQALSGGNLMWINGILFSFGGYSQTDEMIHKQAKGIYNWVVLEYTFEMKQYKPSVNADQLNREVPIYDMSNHPFYQDVAKFIKSKADK